jgi:hypothetical protein
LRAERASNVLLTWCPSIIYLGTDPRFNFEQMYPGDAYVDWVCLDGYAKSPVDSPFDALYGPSLQMMQRLTNKPLLIAELAAGEQAGDGGVAKAAWIRDALGVQIPKWPRIQAVVWFNSPWEGSAYQVDSSRPALQAFRESIGSPYYLSTFTTMSSGAGPVVGQTNFFAETPQGAHSACPAPTRDAWYTWYWRGEVTTIAAAARTCQSADVFWLQRGTRWLGYTPDAPGASDPFDPVLGEAVLVHSQP